MTENDDLTLTAGPGIPKVIHFPGPSDPDEDDTRGDGYRAFGLVRPDCPPPFMLEFRFRTGDSLALSYAWLRRVRYDRSDGLTFDFERDRVVVRGRCLTELHAAVIAHRALWVQEADNPAWTVPASDPLVAEILPSDA